MARGIISLIAAVLPIEDEDVVERFMVPAENEPYKRHFATCCYCKYAGVKFVKNNKDSEFWGPTWS